MTLAVRTSIVGCLLPVASFAQGGGATHWQVNQMQGTMSNAALGVVSNPTSANSQLLIRSGGQASLAPEGWSEARFGVATAIHPDYSMDALLDGFNLLPHTGYPDATLLGFGGISTGGDVCPPIDSTGKLGLNNSWYFLSVTVGGQPGHTYGQPNTVLRSLTHPVGAVISYYDEGSVGIDASLINSTVVEQTGVQLGYSPPSNVEVAGIDWGIGAISVDPAGVRSARLAPVRDRFYCTLTQESCAANPNHKILIATNLVPLNCSTIYFMTWTLPSGWSAPEIAFSSAELFGVNPVPPKEIDAISVYSVTGPVAANRVVFSTTIASQSLNQLLAYDSHSMSAQSIVAQPLKSSGGTLVSQKLGLNPGNPMAEPPTDPDNVLGTCGTDPHEAEALDGTSGHAMSRFDLKLKTPMGLSVYRSISSDIDGEAPVDRLHLLVTGIQLPPSTTGWVHYRIGFPDQQAINNLSGLPPQWYSLDASIVQPGATTTNLEVAGDLPDPGYVSVTATLYYFGSNQPVRTSWISVLDY